MKRFWTQVAVDDGRVVTLDGRPVRTPGRVPLALPTAALAEAVAEEWRAVPETIDPRAMPLTGLANAAIDRIAADRAGFARGLAAMGRRSFSMRSTFSRRAVSSGERGSSASAGVGRPASAARRASGIASRRRMDSVGC